MNTSSEDRPRRNFMTRFAAGLVGGVCGLVPMLAGLSFLGSPLLRKSQAEGGDGFLPLSIGPDAVPTDGTPIAVTIKADRVDAWNVYEDEPIGSVWLRRDDDGKVVVLNTTCPHLGCYVDYRSSHRDFFCPCHTSTFDLDGARLNRIPPRDMDRLEVAERDGRLWVKFQEFRGATPEKMPV